jgi:hypothetical protein
MRRSVIVPIVLVVALLASTTASGSSPMLVHVHLLGFGQPLGATTACPGGQTAIPVLAPNGRRVGSVTECVLSVVKLSRFGLDPWRIVQRVRQTIPLQGGAVRARLTETFTFRRIGYSNARFVGRIVGGEKRYAGMTGAISGGGSGDASAAAWLLNLHFA